MKVLVNSEGRVLPTKANTIRLIDRMIDYEKWQSEYGPTRWARYKARSRLLGLIRAKRDIRRDVGGKRGRVKKEYLTDRLKKTIMWYETPSFRKPVRTENLARLAVKDVLDRIE